LGEVLVAVQNVVRSILAVIFLVGAAVNFTLLMTRPATYEGFADVAIVPFYKTLWRELVVPRLELWVGLVIAFEIALGLLLLGPGVYARVGLVLAAAFVAFLVPFWWGGGALINLAFLGVLIWLLRFDYPAAIWEILFRG
jgi:hypothetical protein